MAEPGPSPHDENGASARLVIDIVRRAGAWDGLNVTDALLERAAKAAFAAVAPAEQALYEVILVLTDDNEMRKLNRTWRGKDGATNVLSFPAGDFFEIDSNVASPLGDVVLAAETVAAEADEQRIPVADHLTHLVVHGLLHLLGFEHEADDEAAEMEALESKILASLDIADPYAEAGDAPHAELAG